MSKVLMSGNVSIPVRANNAARLFFHEEFKKDIDDEINILMSGDPLIRKLSKTGLKFDKVIELIKGISSDDKTESDTALKELSESGTDLEALITLTQVKNAAFKSPDLPAYELMPVVWAMAKAEAIAPGSGDFPPCYRDWLIKNADFDVNDCAEDFKDEIRHGFFRGVKEEEEKE